MTILSVLLIPLLAAAFTALMRERRLMEWVHLASAAGMFVAALALAAEVLRAGPVVPSDGFFYADHLSALVVILTAFVYLVTAPYAIGYFRQEETSPAMLRRYYALTPLFAFCMFLVALASNLGVVWVAVEGTTLASILLVTFYGRPTSLEAAWKYAVLGSVGLSLALFGTVLTYYSAQHLLGDVPGALNWSILAARAGQFDKTVMRLAFIMILLGYGTKAGLAPMHTWKPDVYSEAPVPVAALMSTALLNCALYALARFYVLAARCLGPAFPSRLLVFFGLFTIGIAVPFILVQRNCRRLLAYSSIDHGGIMVLGLGFGGVLGALGMLLHMTFHTVTKPLLFFCAGNVRQHTGSDLLKKGARGLLHTLPVSAPLFLMAALAVTGTPPFSIFQSEFTILRAGFASQRGGAAALFVAFAIAIFCGFFYHISKLVFGPPSDFPRGESSPWTTYPVIGLSLLVLAMGFWLPGPVYALVKGAAQILVVP